MNLNLRLIILLSLFGFGVLRPISSISAEKTSAEAASDCQDLDLSRLLINCIKTKCSADYMYQKDGKMFVDVKGRDQAGYCDIEVDFKYKVSGIEKDRKHLCKISDAKIRDSLAKELSMISRQIGGAKRGFGVLSKECK